MEASWRSQRLLVLPWQFAVARGRLGAPYDVPATAACDSGDRRPLASPLFLGIAVRRSASSRQSSDPLPAASLLPMSPTAMPGQAAARTLLLRPDPQCRGILVAARSLCVSRCRGAPASQPPSPPPALRRVSRRQCRDRPLRLTRREAIGTRRPPRHPPVVARSAGASAAQRSDTVRLATSPS